MRKTLFAVMASLALLMGAGFSRAGADETSWSTQSQTQDQAPLLFAKAVKTHEVKIASTEDTSKDSDGSGVWVSAYAGYDYANMGDMGAVNKGFYDALAGFGDTGTLDASHSGILAGLKFGLDLDKTSSLSLSAEEVWTSRQGVTITSGPDAGISDYQSPSLMNVSLNYSLALINDKGSKTLLSVGSGVYVASIHYDSNLFGEHLVGDFGQTNIGGTLGVSEELSMGGGLSFNCGARFRVADFGNLTSNKVTNNGVAFTGNPFRLADVTLNPIIVVPSQNGSALPSGSRYTDMDYTGLDADLGLTLSL